MTTKYEHRRHRLLTRAEFVQRAARHFAIASGIIAIVVSAGTLGYHSFGRLPWIDSFLNASMILSGMGPVDRMETATAKIFAALYALFSGLVFIGVAGFLVAPWIHRLMHIVHLDESA